MCEFIGKLHGRKVLCLLLLFCLFACSSVPPVDYAVTPPVLPADTVVVFTRSGCPFCRQALEFLRARGVSPLVRDIDQDLQAYQELLAIYREHFPTAKIVVPVIGKEQRYLRGFHPQHLPNWLQQPSPTLQADLDACD
jgi:glutaredoxin